MLNAKDNFRFSQLQIEDRDLTATVGDVVLKALTTRDCLILNCINPHSFVLAQKDERFQEAARAMLGPNERALVAGSR